MKTKISLWTIGILLVTAVLFIGGRLPYFLFYFYIGSLVLPFIHGAYGQRKLNASMTLPSKELMAGEKITLKTHFHNPTKSLYPHLEFQNTLSGLISDEQVADINFHLGPDEQFIDEATIQCKRRGVYTLGETNLLIKDVFNLYTFKKRIQAPLSLKIFPRIRPLNDFSLQAGIQMGDLIVDDPLFQDYSAIDSLRDYRDGDSVKRIHWRASAKQEHLVVKDFEFRGDAEVLLLIDQTLNQYRGDNYRILEDAIVELAVSISHFCLSNHIQTTFQHKTDKGYERISGASEAYLRSFLESYINFQPNQKTSMVSMMNELRPTISQGTSIIILTPKINKELATLLVDLQMTNMRPMLIVMNSMSTASDAHEEEVNLLKKLNIENIPLVKLPIQS